MKASRATEAKAMVGREAGQRSYRPGAFSLVLGRLSARMEHEEHAPITLEQGTYCVRRQRQLEPTDTGFHEDFSTLGD